MGLKLNPTIANFFTQLGIVEELGNGTRTMFKYVPMISGGSDPIIKEEDEFSVNIPYLSQETDNKPTTSRQQTTRNELCLACWKKVKKVLLS